MKCSVILLLAIASGTQAFPGASLYGNARIVGGHEAKHNQFPHQAGLNLYLANGGISFCGGSLISEWYVLTAAHCTTNVKKIEVILGAHKVDDLSEPTQIRMNTSIIIPHELWYPTLLLNDVAVVKLPRPVKFNKNIAPIDLPVANGDDFAGRNATVSGWGKDSDESVTISPVLRYVEIGVITVKDCQESYPKVIHETHLCTSGKDGKSACSGDSGGPLVLTQDNKLVQIGIVSFGKVYCERGYPAVFTRVTSYLDWITKNAELGYRQQKAII